MIQIQRTMKGKNKLFVLTLPIAVSELHLPNDVENIDDSIHHHWWSNGEKKNTLTKILEIRLWADNAEQAVDIFSTELSKISNR